VVVQVVLALGVVVASVGGRPWLIATTFDPAHAATVGIRVVRVDAAVLVSLALVVVVGLTTVGVLMAVTLAVAPAVAAGLVTDRLGRQTVVAVAFGLVSGFGGLMAAYHLSLPAGPAVAVTAVLIVGLCAVASRRRSHVERIVEGHVEREGVAP
jgi:ABC-type Mn2+/Zn2+ transport system permease subunit